MSKAKISTPYPSLKTIARELGVTKSRVDKIVGMVQSIQGNKAEKTTSASAHRHAKAGAKNRKK